MPRLSKQECLGNKAGSFRIQGRIAFAPSALYPPTTKGPYVFKKTIKFKDLDGNPVEEDFYFNLNAPEIAEMELEKEGGMHAYLQEITEGGNPGKIMSTFKMFLERSIGRRSEDGRRLLKSQEITDDFMMSDAYSEFFLELVTNSKMAATFVNGILPEGLAERLAQQTGDAPDMPAWIREDREPTKEELMAMDKMEMVLAMQHIKKKPESEQGETDPPAE